MTQKTSLADNNTYPDSVNRYIKKLLRFEKTGKILLSITISITIAVIGFFLVKRPGTLIAFEDNALGSFYNLIILLLFLFSCLLVCVWLFIWRPKKQKMNIFTAAITIQKYGNSYVTPYGRLFVPYPWIRLIKDGTTASCMLGQWNSFSLTHNGVYLLGISEYGFDIEKHKDKGFFKFKGMPTFIFLFLLFIGIGFLHFVYTTNMEYYTREIGKLAVLIEYASLIISAGSFFFILFFLARNIRIKRQIKQSLITAQK